VRRALSWLWMRLSTDESLSTEASLCVKLLALCWLITGHALYVPRVFLPFMDALNLLPFKELFWGVLLGLGLLSVAAILLSYRTRAFCLSLAAVIFLSTLSSRIYFSNNRLFCACIFLLVGLTDVKGRPVLIRYQLVILYAGAALDKLLNADWRSGQFMESFAQRLGEFGSLWSPNWKIGEPNVFLDLYLWLGAQLPPMTLSVLTSWATILTELTLAFLFLLGWIRPAIILGVLFHSGLLLLTGSTMGMFFYAVLCSFIACLALPSLQDFTKRDRVFGGALLFAILLAGPWFRSWMVFLLPPFCLFFARSISTKDQAGS
jgi:hypothetical protein